MTYGTIYAKQDGMEECGHCGQECGAADGAQGTADQFVTGPMTGEAENAASLAFKKAVIDIGFQQISELMGFIQDVEFPGSLPEEAQ